MTELRILKDGNGSPWYADLHPQMRFDIIEAHYGTHA